MTNLAVNARDAMPQGGELTFEVDLETRAGGTTDAGPGPGEWAVLRVGDTGAGMSAEVRERIFEPFFTTKAPGRGTGLGLSQAYGIVQQHGGHITVESEPGRGTTFALYFPTLPAATSTAGGDARASLPPQGHGETLLLVEDEPRVRKALAEMLGDLNYCVVTAASAEEAIELHTKYREEVALVLTDLVMPGIGGIGLLGVLRARDPELRVVMMTGCEGSLDEPLPGVAAWIQKPATPRVLGTVIRQALTDASRQ